MRRRRIQLDQMDNCPWESFSTDEEIISIGKRNVLSFHQHLPTQLKNVKTLKKMKQLTRDEQSQAQPKLWLSCNNFNFNSGYHNYDFRDSVIEVLRVLDVVNVIIIFVRVWLLWKNNCDFSIILFVQQYVKITVF